jgi:tetratricopeptide (TPR) repeat protein
VNDFFSRHQALIWRVFMAWNLMACGVLSTAFAQTLDAEPWPPKQGQKFDLVGRGFPIKTSLNLEFNDPKPLSQNGKPATSTLITSATGTFRLALEAKGKLDVRAVVRQNGAERSVSLALPAASGQTALSAASSTSPAPTSNPPPPAPTGPITVKLENGVLQGTRDGVSVWSLPTTTTVPPITQGDQVVTVDGTTVVARERGTGNAVWRAFLSGPITALEANGTDLRATVTHAGDANGTGRATEPFTVQGGKPVERVTFPPSKALLDSLEGAARANLSFDPVQPTDATEATKVMRERLSRDPTNPFNALFLGAALERDGKTTQANATYARALEIPAPFYASIRLAALLETIKRPELADRALEAARTSWAKAGYDPGFRVGADALQAWGDPLTVARARFADRDAVRGAAWMGFLRSTMPRFAGYESAYTEYAAWLEAQGSPVEARDLRNFNAELAQGTPFNFGEDALPMVANLALVAVVALLAAYLALQITLAMKYWIAQGRDLRPLGGRWGAWGRSPLLRLRHSLPAYQTVTEKLVLIVLLALAALSLIIWTWALRGHATLQATALNAGTVGGEAFYSSLSGFSDNPKLQTLRGLASQLDGQTERAAMAYRTAPKLATAQNNLGVIEGARGDQAGAQTAYREASTLDSTAVAPRWNLGLNPNGYRVAFHNIFAPGAPMLSVPEPKELLEASAGNLSSEFFRVTADPWSYLTRLPLNLPNWTRIGGVDFGRIVIAVAVLAVLVLNVLWLIVPRVRSARLAPRSVVYEFLALIVPGSGLADELWGVLLIVPWAVLGGALVILNAGPRLLPGLLAPSSPLGLIQVPPLVDLSSVQTWLYVALGVVYVINFIGWLIEAITFRRHLRSIQNPTQAQNALKTQSSTPNSTSP